MSFVCDDCGTLGETGVLATACSNCGADLCDPCARIGRDECSGCREDHATGVLLVELAPGSVTRPTDEEREIDRLRDQLRAVVVQRDTLKAEVERLTGCLVRSNSNMEEMERDLYLRLAMAEAERDALKAKLTAIETAAGKLARGPK